MFEIEKKSIRKNILKVRDELSLDKKNNMDTIIRKKFLNSEYYKAAKKIFIYVSFKSEIDTKKIIKEAFKDNKEIYIPRTDIKNKIMEAAKITSLDNLSVDSYGILEPPQNNEVILADNLDLIVVPGVAFDKNGGRMGYGAGYYDRYFKQINSNDNKVLKVALAYDFQILEKIPMDKYDMPIDSLITNDNE